MKNNKFQKIRTALGDWRTKAGVVMTAGYTMILPAFASEGETADTLVKRLLEYVFDFIRYAGIFVVLIGVYSFLSAWKQDNADARQNGIVTALVGVALIFLKTFFEGLNLI